MRKGGWWFIEKIEIGNEHFAQKSEYWSIFFIVLTRGGHERKQHLNNNFGPEIRVNKYQPKNTLKPVVGAGVGRTEYIEVAKIGGCRGAGGVGDAHF